MKKLMLTLAAIATATVVNAAACAWSGAGVTLQTGDVATQYTMYLLDASVTSASDMATYLSAGDTSKLAAATVQTTTGVAVGTTAARWNSSFGNYTAGDEYTYYTVILDGAIDTADAYMITAEKTAKVPAAGNLVMGFGTQASNTWNEMSSSSVPEPTSGLLLLLGVAGLALKRKRA